MPYELIAFILLAILSILNIVAVETNNSRLEHLTKPLLMPVLLAAYLFAAQKPEWLLAAALICGFAGDVFLMGPAKLFAAGLFSFFAGHIFYIFLFLREIELSSVPGWFWILLLPYLLGAAAGYRLLLPSLGKMKIPALLYMLCIITMSFTCLLRAGSTGGFHFWLPYAGSLLFIVSDSLLAVGSFVPKAKSRGGIVMATYVLAQTLIVCGFLL